MTEARPLVESHCAEGDIDAVALAIAMGYQHTNELMCGNLALCTFPVGLEQRPYILRAMIDFALKKVADERDGFFWEAKWNAAHNCRSLILTRNRLFITQHFMGKDKFRQCARHAKSREPLAGRNLPLFDERESVALFKDGGYVQFLHGGKTKPEFIALVIPTEDQQGFRARSVIEVPQVQSASVPETIREELEFQLREDASSVSDEDNKNLLEDVTYEESG